MSNLPHNNFYYSNSLYQSSTRKNREGFTNYEPAAYNCPRSQSDQSQGYGRHTRQRCGQANGQHGQGSGQLREVVVSCQNCGGNTNNNQGNGQEYDSRYQLESQLQYYQDQYQQSEQQDQPQQQQNIVVYEIEADQVNGSQQTGQGQQQGQQQAQRRGHHHKHNQRHHPHHHKHHHGHHHAQHKHHHHHRHHHKQQKHHSQQQQEQEQQQQQYLQQQQQLRLQQQQQQYLQQQQQQQQQRYQQSGNGSVSEEEDIFVMFYAPWCGHCQRSKPQVERSFGGIAAEYDDYRQGNYQKHDGKVAIVMLNGDDHPEITRKFGVKSFPTFKMLQGVKDRNSLRCRNVNDYSGDRSSQDIENYIFQSSQSEPAYHQDTYRNQYENFSSPQEDVFVMFYAPWCGHCTRSKPHVQKSLGGIATEYNDYRQGQFKKHKGKIAIVLVNGDEHPEVAKKFGVRGYPTFKLCKGVKDRQTLHSDEVQEYEGGRDQASIENFLDY